MNTDHVDRVLSEWAAEWPELDTSAQGVIGRISRLSRFLERDVVGVFKRFGLTGGEFDVLATLRRTPGPIKALTPTDLTAACMLSSAAMTNRIDRLEQAGLVTRDRTSVDRRAVFVRLSPKGQDLIEQALVMHMSGEAEMLSALTASDKATLARLLRKLLIPIEQNGRNGDPGAHSTGELRPASMTINNDHHVDNDHPYSEAIVAGGLVFLSGCLPDDQVAPFADGRELLDAAMKTVERRLRNVGGTLGDIVKLTYYVTDIGLRDAANQQYIDLWDEPRPTRTLIGVAGLPRNSAVEIDAIARQPQ